MGAVIRTSTMPPAQAKTDHWALLARIAAHRDRFGASDAIAASAALLLVRTQLMLGVASARELQEFAKVVGVEALTDVVKQLAAYEVKRILANIEPLQAETLTPSRARRRLVAYVRDEAEQDLPLGGEPEPVAVRRVLKRHQAFGVRRLR
jgi:hypothetical protein